MTIIEILSELLREPKIPYWFLRHLLFLQVETLPSRHEILRWDSLSFRWIPVSEWVLGIRILFLIFFAEPSATRNINYPSFLGVIKTSFAFSLSGYIFWCVSLFPILQSQQSEYILPKFSPRTKHVLEGFTKSSFILIFPVCQEVLVISQTAIALHRIQPLLIIRSRLQKKRLMSLLWFDVQLVLQFRLSLIDEVWLLDDSMMMLHNICQILMNCTYE